METAYQFDYNKENNEVIYESEEDYGNGKC